MSSILDRDDEIDRDRGTDASSVGWEHTSKFPGVETHCLTSLDCKTESGVLLELGIKLLTE